MKTAELKSLPVRTRRIVSEGGTRVARSVLCPSRGEVDLETCSHCGNLHRVQLADQPAVECRVYDPESESNLVAERMAQRVLAKVAERTPISRVMTRDVVCVTEDLDVDTLTALLLDRGISAVPVVGATGLPIGVVSKTDLVRDGWENGGISGEPLPLQDAALVAEGFCVTAPPAKVRDVMTPLAFTLHDTEPLASAASMMALEGVHRVPVVDRSGRVVGIVSSLDLVRWLTGLL